MPPPLLPRRRYIFSNLGRKYSTQRPEKNISDYKLDQASGQVYTETVIRGIRRDDSYWEYHPNSALFVDPPIRTVNKSKPKRIPGNEHFSGTRSLLLTSLDEVVTNVLDLTAELLIQMPINIIELLWKALSERSLISFHLWSIFSVRLFEQKNVISSKLTYYQNISSPKSPLAIYTQALTSTSFEFITALVITTPFSVPDFINMSTLVNLVTLEIINYSDPHHSVVSDHLVKAWSLCASQKKSFQVLRILRFWNHREITPKSLEYLLHFPVLTLYDVQGCSFDRFKSQKYTGWNYVGNRISLASQKKKCFKGLDCRNCVPKVSTQDSTQGNSSFKRENSKTNLIIDMICQDCAPLACLRLGPTYPLNHEPFWFLRIKGFKEDTTNTSVIPRFKNLKNQMASLPSSKSLRRHVRRNNKRNLDEFLLEFL
ncbi:putative cbs domain-containing protein [Erysiphe neolycopersici]|uniref:Putative cbs domain-containing protein n=1 Tax=Erysiphe neolycopersici TaxID=212602 RepID=A0A420I8K1_9PEZI|nr:putative cbs domain-containing protein [Erysiphe neolycopersici]